MGHCRAGYGPVQGSVHTPWGMAGASVKQCADQCGVGVDAKCARRWDMVGGGVRQWTGHEGHVRASVRPLCAGTHNKFASADHCAGDQYGEGFDRGSGAQVPHQPPKHSISHCGLAQHRPCLRAFLRIMPPLAHSGMDTCGGSPAVTTQQQALGRRDWPLEQGKFDSLIVRELHQSMPLAVQRV